MTKRLPLDSNSNFRISGGNCTGCLLCQLACSFIKTSSYGLSSALIYIDRDVAKGPYEQYTISFAADCDSCGFCANYCAFDALVNLKRTKVVN